MSKVASLVSSWYWPEEVQRYLAAPQVALYDLTVGRWARRYGDSPALLGRDWLLTFRQLDEATGRVLAACSERMGPQGAALALAVRSPRSFAVLVLGLLRANNTLLLLDPEAPRQELAASLALFRADALITDAVPDLGETAGVPLLPPESLLEAAATPRPAPPADPRRPAIALPVDGRMAYHSQVSALSAAMAFAAFALAGPQERMVVARPCASWEGLIGLLAPLQAGEAAVLPQSLTIDDVAEAIGRSGAALLWTDEAGALGLLEGGRSLVEAVQRHCRGAYISVHRAPPRRLRRSLRRILRVHILTLYGHPATGVIAAAHPSWYLEEAIGIPMTGVDLVAVEPESRRAVDTPWELLAYAGIGAKTRAAAVNFVGGDRAGLIEEGLFYTGDLGLVDANGMLYLLPRPGQ